MTQRNILRVIGTTIAVAQLFDSSSFAAGAPLPKTSQELCALLSPRVASIVLKGPASPDPVQLSNEICLWKVPSLRTKSPFLTYSLIHGGIAGTKGVTRPVKGVGDMAFWSARDGSLLASRHDVSIDVHLKAWDGTPIDDEAGAAAVARDVLSHF